MHMKRFLGATLVLFVFIFFYEWIVHGMLLMSTYMMTPHVWRDFAEMKANMPMAMIVQFVLAVWITFAFTQLYPEGGLANGLRYGLYFGVFAGILTASWYLWLPVSPHLGWSWLAGGIGEGLGAGIVLGYVYRR